MFEKDMPEYSVENVAFYTEEAKETEKRVTRW
jgi:hypothetical protein